MTIEGRYIDSNDPARCSWNKELEMGLPDCRLRGPSRRSTVVPYGRMMMEKVYCGSCGRDGGLVTAEMFPHVFFLCDGCVEQFRPPPGVVQMTEEDERRLRGLATAA